MELLVDADILACQFAYAYETRRWQDTDGTFDMDDAKWAITGFDSAVERMQLTTGTEKVILCFTGRGNFRYSILPTYKRHRRGKPKPVLLDVLIEHAREKWNCKAMDCLEADDVMGIVGTTSPGSYIIATLDKDMKQIPGALYNWRTDHVEEIDTYEADYWFYFQVLTGDTTDGYAGCPGIGVQRARTILKGVTDEPWKQIVAAYESRGLTEADALVQARVARVLRAEDFDFEDCRPILWSPN